MSDHQFHVQVLPSEGVVRVAGDLDISTSGALSDALDRLVSESDGDVLTFDLGDVGFMDSSGLAVLMRAAATGRRVVVRGASLGVRLALEATGLVGVVEVEP